MGKVPGFQFNYEVAEDPSYHKGSRFQYEDIKNSSWIFGLTLILVFLIARWSINRKNPIPEDPVVIIQKDMKNENYGLFFNSDQLSFLWTFCNKTTFECSWCPPGWIEQGSRCYLMFEDPQSWDKAQEICTYYQGSLPVVLNADDQILLSKMAHEQKLVNPKVNGVWIGLADIETEGDFTWVNGKMLTENDSFWQVGNPNNMIPFYDKLGEGQDCVAIVPPKNLKKTDWYYSWDDIICRSARPFICEIPNFLLRQGNYGNWERAIQSFSQKSHTQSKTAT